MVRYLSPDDFRAAVKSGAKADDLAVAAGAQAVVKAANAAARTLDFVISTGDLDRHGDRVNPEGWILGPYLKNPVVTFNHDYNVLPVARAKNVRLEDGKLKATAEFTPLGFRQFNDVLYDYYDMGYMKAVSVGFLPRKWSWAEGSERKFGIDYQECELLEFACVVVPALSNALLIEQSLFAKAAAAGDGSPEMRTLAEKVKRLKDQASRPRLIATQAKLAKVKAAMPAFDPGKPVHDGDDAAMNFFTIARKAQLGGNYALAKRALDAGRRLRGRA